MADRLLLCARPLIQVRLGKVRVCKHAAFSSLILRLEIRESCFSLWSLVFWISYSLTREAWIWGNFKTCDKAETVGIASKERSALEYGPEGVTDHQWGWKRAMETACEGGESQDKLEPVSTLVPASVSPASTLDDVGDLQRKSVPFVTRHTGTWLGLQEAKGEATRWGSRSARPCVNLSGTWCLTLISELRGCCHTLLFQTACKLFLWPGLTWNHKEKGILVNVFPA